MLLRPQIIQARRKQRGFIINPFAFGGGGGGGGSDPHFASVVVLAHFDGTNGSTTLTNEIGSGPAIVGAASDACISTAQSVYGGASLRVQNLNVAGCASHTAFNYGTGDFTFEFRFRVDALSGAQVLMDSRAVSSEGAYPALYINGGDGVLYYYVSSANRITTASGVISAATWHAISISRVSGTTRLFVDGVQGGSDYTDSTDYIQTQMLLGRSSYNTGQCTGHWDELRVTKGVGRYTTTYTPDASAFPNS